MAGPELRPLLDRTGKAPLRGAALSGLQGALGALRYLPRTRFLSLPPMLRRLDPRRASGRRDLERSQNSGGRGRSLSSAREGEV